MSITEYVHLMGLLLSLVKLRLVVYLFQPVCFQTEGRLAERQEKSMCGLSY